MKVLANCPLCGCAGLEPFSMEVWRPGVLHFAQARCGECGLIAAQPQTTEEELQAYYAQRYYQHHPLDAEAHWRENVRDYPQYEIPLMERLWQGFAPTPGASLAEIGCGNGSLLSIMRERGYRVRGCELSPVAVSFCRSKGLDVVEGKVLDGGAFDVVASFQVIEHVPDPRAFVHSLARLARPGGVVVIATENAWTSQFAFTRLAALLRGKATPYRTSTEHTFVFQGHHLERLLQEAGCDTVRSSPFHRGAPKGSLHFRAYRGAFWLADQFLGGGEYLMAVGRRAATA